MIVILIAIGAQEKNPLRLSKGPGRLRNQRTSEDHPDDSIINTG